MWHIEFNPPLCRTPLRSTVMQCGCVRVCALVYVLMCTCHRVLRQSQMERIMKKRASAGKPRFIPKHPDDEGVDARELVPVFLLLLWVTMGCIYGVEVEGFQPITALYFSVTSLSTGR